MKRNHKPLILLLLVAGILLTAYGVAARIQWKELVIVTVDDTPPIVNPIVPQDGQVIMEGDFKYIYVEVIEDESVVRSCTYGAYEDGVWIELDGDGNWQMLFNAHGGQPYGTWGTHYHSYKYKQVGSHTFTIVATNTAGLWTEVSGTYTIYGSLNGTWAINDKVITSADQHLTLATRTLTFTFNKTKGLADESITCTVDWDKDGNPERGTMTLDYMGDGVWSATRTFVSGKYNIDLIADDGYGQITLSLYGMSMGADLIPTEDLALAAGVGLIVGAVALYRAKP